MKTTLLFLLAQASGQPAGGSLIGGLLPFILIFAIMYFLILRPQAKKQRDQRKMIESLDKGDQIVTIGGIYGQIISVKEGTLVVKIADNVKIEILRSAVARKLAPEELKN